MDRPGFTVHVHPGEGDYFEVSASDMRPLVRLLLRRQRERSGLSLADAAARLGAKSRNAYARYERGTSLPTVEKLDALLHALLQGYPGQPPGLGARHLTTLAALIRGIGGRQSTQRPKVATHVPDGAQPDRRGKRFARWGDHAPITTERSFVPYAEGLLAHLALETLVRGIDGSGVGRGAWR